MQHQNTLSKRQYKTKVQQTVDLRHRCQKQSNQCQTNKQLKNVSSVATLSPKLVVNENKTNKNLNSIAGSPEALFDSFDSRECAPFVNKLSSLPKSGKSNKSGRCSNGNPLTY